MSGETPPDPRHGGATNQLRLSIIFVTWNGWPLLHAALRSLADTGQAPASTEILVVDNGSSDGTAEALAAHFPQARHLPQATNLGFAAANNIGAHAASADLLLLLNNDTIVHPHAIDELMAAAQAHPDFHIFVPEMRMLRTPDRVDNRGIYLDASAHFRQLDSNTPVANRRSRAEVFGASGGACLIRTEVVRTIGLFDVTLESYLEDADFAARARVNGFRALFVPDSVILHAGSATAQRIADRKFFLIQRNMRTLWHRWIAPALWRPTWWTGNAYECFQALKAARAGRLTLLLNAKRAAGHTAAPRRERASLASWIGVKARPLPDAPRT